ncbi:MAG: hypothetical protein C4543_06150 [Ignavibacteriales bacterium]|jgi:hypothetical protein|nr:MAG: hypothetical protein C4543_06150 [Ignavibacteriales bacterium]
MEDCNDGKMEWWNIEFISWIPAFAGMTKRGGHSVMWSALPPTLIQKRHPALAGILHGISCMIRRLEDWMKERKWMYGIMECWKNGMVEFSLCFLIKFCILCFNCNSLGCYGFFASPNIIYLLPRFAIEYYRFIRI